MSYQYTPIRMAQMKKTDNTVCIDEKAEQLELSYFDVGKVKWSSHFEKQFGHTEVWHFWFSIFL